MAEVTSITERTPVSVIDELDDCLFRIGQASDLALEAAQPLHDRQEAHYIVSRLSFLTKIIDESVARIQKLSDDGKLVGRNRA